MTRPPQRSPRPPKVDDRDPDETLESLVADVFGGKPRRTSPDDTIMVPPEPAPEPPPVEPPAAPPAAPQAPSAAEAAPSPVASADETVPPTAPSQPERRRPSLLQRLQVSPAVIVASILAGATGAAADAWFEDIASFFSELTAGTEHAAVMPEGIAPSSFTEEERDAPQTGEAATAAEPEPAAAQEPLPPAQEAPRGSGLPVSPSVAPAAEEPAPAEAAAAPADRVRVITWDESGEGTVVTLWGNGGFLAERIARFRIEGGRPRELVKLRGIDLPFPQPILDLGTPEVSRIRTGFHPQDRVNELHMVLDLTGPDVVVDRVETGPDNLRLHLRRGGPVADPAQ